MKLEQQCVSLELAKRLKELGVNAVSYFSFVSPPGGTKDNFDAIQVSPIGKKTLLAKGYDVIAAYTVAELGEMLGKETNGIMFCDGKWASVAPPLYEATASHTEADARAKMLACLVENKLITLP